MFVQKRNNNICYDKTNSWQFYHDEIKSKFYRSNYFNILKVFWQSPADPLATLRVAGVHEAQVKPWSRQLVEN